MHLQHFQFSKSGEDDTVFRGKLIEDLLDISAIPLIDVCLLLGCWQSFYSYSKTFVLISYMDTLNLKKS